MIYTLQNLYYSTDSHPHTWREDTRNAEKIFKNVIYNPSATRARGHYWFCRFLSKIACLSRLDIEKTSTGVCVNRPFYEIAQWHYSFYLTCRVWHWLRNLTDRILQCLVVFVFKIFSLNQVCLVGLADISYLYIIATRLGFAWVFAIERDVYVRSGGGGRIVDLFWRAFFNSDNS